MEISKKPNEFVPNNSDGLSFMEKYHKETNRDIVGKLTGGDMFGVNGVSQDWLTYRATLGAGEDTLLDGEHLIDVRDISEIYTHHQEQNKYTHEVVDVTTYHPGSTVGKYVSNDFNDTKLYKNNDEVTISTALNVTKDEYKSFTYGSTLANPEDMFKNRFSRFNRFGYIDAANEFLTGSREYIFFSKPDLHLMDKDDNSNPVMYSPLLSNAFLREAYEHYRYSFYSLQQTYPTVNIPGEIGAVNAQSVAKFDPYCKYIPLLSNMVTSTLDLSDITAGEVENNRNLYQINTTYREGSISSDLQYDFSLEFKDTKYLDVYMLFKIYDEYFRHKFYEEIEPADPEYILNRIYPEAMSIWKIIVDDTDRIIYWAKAIGCTPMSVPRGSLSNFENQIKFTVNWKAQFIKDMDPVNLMELNHLTNKSMLRNYQGAHASSVLSGKQPALLSQGETWVGYPYIIKDERKSMDDTSALFRTSSRTGDIGNGNTAPQCFYKLMWIY